MTWRSLAGVGALALGVAWIAGAVYGQARPAEGSAGVVEIRSYNLKPGRRDAFHQRFVRDALPMLARWNVDVVAYGPSLHDRDSYFLMRAYPSVEAREKSEDAFYGSDEWKNGIRDAVLGDIDSYTTIVVHPDGPTISGLRALIQR